MKNLNFASVIIVLSFVFLFSNLVSAQSNKKTEVKQIEAYSQTLDTFGKKNKNLHPVFADVSDPEKDKNSLWRKYNSVIAFKKATKKLNPYEIAEVWEKENKIALVFYFLTSPSGDWNLYTYYYYRADGTLAKVEEQLNVFGLEGLIYVTRNYYFDEAGKLLQKTAKYYDPNTKKYKKAGQVNFMNREAEIYKKNSELPFAKLVGKM